MTIKITDAAVVDRAGAMRDHMQAAGIAGRIFSDGITKDAPEALAFLTSQLAYVEARIYEKKRQPMQYAMLVPVSTEAGEYAQSIEYEIYDYAGKGKKHSGKGGDIPRVDVAYGRKSLPVSLGAIGYDYTTEELRVSSYMRRPLDERRASVAIEAYERHLNDVALNGEAESGFTGLYNNASVPQGNAAAGVGGVTWALKTPMEILKDVNDLITSVWTSTQYNEAVDTIVIAADRYAYIATTPLSATFPNKTILQYLKENNLSKVERGIDVTFAPGYGLGTAGVGGTARMLGYVRQEDRVKMHLPMPIRFMAPQIEGFTFSVPGQYKYGQVHFYYPRSARYVDGI